TARSAEAATSGLTVSSRLRAAADSPTSTIRSRAAMKGSRWWVAKDKARATTAAVMLATQMIGTKSRFHARAEAEITNTHRMAAVTDGGRTLNRRVSSQSMGPRINADVQA